MADELVFNTCLEDVEYFIERFERRASNPGGERFSAPLDRLRQLRERLQHLRDLGPGETSGSTATLLTPPVVSAPAGDFDEKLTKLQESVEQRFSRLNLTVSSILENLTSIPRNLEIGLQSIDKALQNIDAQVSKVQEDAAKDREQWTATRKDVQELSKKLEEVSGGAGQADEVLGGVEDLTNDMLELRDRMKALEQKLGSSESESLQRLEKQSELIEEVAQGTDSMQIVFKSFLNAVKTIQWPSTSGTMMIPPAVPVVTPISSTMPVHKDVEEKSLTDTLNLNTGGGFIPPGSRPSTTRFPVLKESEASVEFVGDDDEDFTPVGETIQMSAAETAQLVASVREEEDDAEREDGSATLVTPMRFLGNSEDPKDVPEREPTAGEFKFTLDDVDI